MHIILKDISGRVPTVLVNRKTGIFTVSFVLFFGWKIYFACTCFFFLRQVVICILLSTDTNSFQILNIYCIKLNHKTK